MKRVLREPAFELADDFAEEILAAGETVSLGEENQVSVAIELPNDLVVTGFGGVEIGDTAEIDGAGFDAARIVAPPADFLVRLERAS